MLWVFHTDVRCVKSKTFLLAKSTKCKNTLAWFITTEFKHQKIKFIVVKLQNRNNYSKVSKLQKKYLGAFQVFL